MKLYLSGPMTGLPELNYPAFMLAAKLLRERNHFVYNPAEWEERYGFTEFNIRVAFADYCYFIARDSEAVVTLPGWENSPGATAEVYLARAIKIPVYTVEDVLAA